MKRKKIILLIILTMLAVMLTASGCNRIKTRKDYYLYTFQPVKGEFVRNSTKITFRKDNYTSFNNSGQVADLGEFKSGVDMVTFIPDKIGNANRMAAKYCMYVYKEYLIDTGQVFSRVSEEQFEDRDELEGVYDAGFMLKDKVIYRSADNSGTEQSFTEKAGTYIINKDFIICYRDDGTIVVLLQFVYKDALGYKVKALGARFFSYKSPNLKKIKLSDMELETKIYEKSLNNTYNLSVIVYPKDISISVTYKVLNNAQATISGSTLTFAGSGALNIEYSYGEYTKTERIIIVDMNLSAGYTDADRTYKVGDIEDYDDVISAAYDYYSDWSTYESIQILGNTKAESKNGSVEFNEAGLCEAKLVIRYVRPYLDGKNQVVELKKDIIFIINQN